jgi:flagellar motility protein MotE (MotC chaperone)
MVHPINPSAARVAPEAEPHPGSIPAWKPVARKSGRLRVIPLTMTMLGLLLVLKTNDIYFTSQAIRSSLVANAEASAPKKKEGEGEAAAKEGAEKAKKPEPPKVSESEINALKKLEEQTKYSQVELDLLHNLSKRREELDARERELEIKTKVLDATEQRINGRIEEMKSLQAEVKVLMDAYKEQQDSDVRSLVKIYENMKPVDAATIFNELDMPILLSVIDKMSERKVAPVLAAMSPLKAKEVTEELAELRKSTALPASANSAATR